MNYYAASRLTVLDVKWTKQYRVNETFNAFHYNPYYELIVVTEGPVYLQVEDERFILEAGETFLLHPWERHRGWRKPESASAFFWVQFSADPPLKELNTSTKPIDEYEILHAEKNELRTAAMHDVNQLLIPRRFKPNRRYKILNHFENLIHEMEHPVGYFRFRLTQQLGQIFETISTDLLEQQNQTMIVPGSYLIYRQLLSLFHDLYQTDLTKEVIELKMNRSYEHLSQVFKKHAGTNIVHYLHQLRVQRAKHLLAESDLSIQQIAREVGIEDAFYFSKIFKQLEGMPPSKYRERFSQR